MKRSVPTKDSLNKKSRVEGCSDIPLNNEQQIQDPLFLPPQPSTSHLIEDDENKVVNYQTDGLKITEITSIHMNEW